ncbi:COP23 domain-containing protein [Acaryochloris sp. IP29b_bin.137]|uniref:COP23 domain-containing protein n=1 Tax=Acaryochloris sp. IP29b_bin.137 TaxID=2969217 RepID=UPI00262CFE6F|nr:COP23 domain-containing protein [Acaryochloris sp. IP29b_bin.137]
MKRYPIISLLTLPVVVGATLWVSRSPAQAREPRFSCGQSQNAPTTLAKTKQGFVAVIRWTSEHFAGSGWTPEARCQKVSGLFEQYYREGSLNYLTTERDRTTRQNVVCVAPAPKKKCTGILFTLKPGSNPGKTLQRLMDLRVRASQDPLNETNRRIYIKMDEFLNSRPTIDATPTASSKSGTPSQAQPDESSAPSQPKPDDIW